MFNECQKFVKEEGDAIDVFAFLCTDVQPNQLIKRLQKKVSLPINNTAGALNPTLSKSQGKLLPIQKEMNLKTNLQCASVGGLQPKIAVWRKWPPKKLGEGKRRIDDVREQFQVVKPLQQNKKMENFQNSVIPKKPQQSRLDDLEGPSPYDGQWANHILKGFFKVQVKKQKDHKWVVQKFKEEEDEEEPITVLEDQAIKAIRQQEAMFRYTAQKGRRKESIPTRDTNKRFDDQMNETGIQRSNPSLQSYISKKAKSRRGKGFNLVAQQFVQSAFEEPTFMPIFDLNFEKNYATRVYIAEQRGQLGMVFAQ